MANPNADRAQTRRARATLALLLAAGVAGATPRALAAQVVDVRLGRHPGFTRLVLELDAATGYRLEGPKEGLEPRLRLTVEARSAPRAVAIRDPLVRSVQVEPAGEGCEVTVDLASPRVDVTEMILSGPPRIVLDLHRVGEPGSAGTAPAKAAPPPKPAPAKPVSAPAGAPLEAVPEVTEPEVAEPEASESRPALPGTEPAPPSGIRGGVPGASVAAGVSGESPARQPRGAGAAPTRRPPALRRQPAATGASHPPAETPPGGFRRNAGRILIALGVLILLAVWIRTRRRKRASELAEEERMTSNEEPAAMAALADPSAEAPLAPEPAAESPAGAPPRGIEESGVEEAGPLPSELISEDARPGLPDPIPEAPPVQAIPETPPWHAFEERLARIEARLEDLLDARDRMDRQLAAHTEELRVQRSAVARTQRVVRSLARPEPGAGSPGPGSGPR